MPQDFLKECRMQKEDRCLWYSQVFLVHVEKPGNQYIRHVTEATHPVQTYLRGCKNGKTSPLRSFSKTLTNQKDTRLQTPDRTPQNCLGNKKNER